MKITSTSNPRIQAALRALESGERMLLEGVRAIGEALAAGIVPEEIFLEGEERTGGEGSVPAIEQATEHGASLCFVTSKVLSKLSDLPSARGVVALAVPPRRSLPDLYLSKNLPSVPVPHSSASSTSSSSNSLFVLLDGVQDPANVGAIVRSAEAFGAAGVVLTPDCASPFSPKAVRASALSALRVPLATGVTPRAAVAWADGLGASLAGAEARGGDPPASISGLRPLVLVIGSEGRGISAVLESRLDRRVTIPLAGQVESLNASVAAGVLLALISGRAL
ncbi:MAG TPA: RNA methyltransferase [Thermoanaerobaculia bacterium]|nr:RNA methyltransferase [Thermoanaerobaculia bacterium]